MSDTVHDAKNILKNMSYKCKECEMLKLPIERGFTNGVCNNICQYMICNNFSRIIHKTDDMNNKDIDVRNNETIGDDLEIFVIIEMNNFLTIEGFDNLLYQGDDEGNDNDFIFKYYSMVKRLYNMSFSIKRLKYETLNDNDFDFLHEALNDEYKTHELRYTITRAIGIMGMFRTQIGSNIYNETTCDKIIERINEEWCLLKNE